MPWICRFESNLKAPAIIFPSGAIRGDNIKSGPDQGNHLIFKKTLPVKGYVRAVRTAFLTLKTSFSPSGSSAATVATIGKMSLPELERRGYDRAMSLGSLAGSGTLGFMIPPSLIMIVLTLPVGLPLITHAGFDPVWFGIFMVVMAEIAQVTPPVGFNLFVLQGMTKRDIFAIAKDSWVFCLLLIVAAATITVFPAIALWLPSKSPGG